MVIINPKSTVLFSPRTVRGGGGGGRCQKLWALLSNFGFFYDDRSQNMVISHDLGGKFRKVLFSPNSTFNIWKSYYSTSEVISQKPSGGWKTSPPPVPLGLKAQSGVRPDSFGMIYPL